MASEYLSPIERIGALRSTLRYRYRLILLVFVAVLASSAIYIMRMPDVYRSETRILVNPQRISDKYVNSVVSMDASERLNTLSQQVLSSSRLEKIMDEFNLFPNLRDKVSHEELIERMRKNIGIELKHNSDGLSAFTLSYTGDSAEEVALVANRLAESFISWNLRDREQEAKGTTAFLANELSTTKSQLDSLEEQVRSYKMSHLGELPDQMQANMQTLARLQTELQANTEAQSRLDHEALLTTTMETDTSSTRTFTTSAGTRQRLLAERASAQAELSDLRKRYTDSFPDVTRKEAEIQALNERIAATPATDLTAGLRDTGKDASPHLQIIRRDRDRLVNDQRRIEASIRRYQGRVDSEPVREQEVSQLLRDYDTTRDHYRSLLEKTYSAEMAAQLESKQQGGSFTMLDRARVPEIAVGPKRIPLLIGAFLLALLAGVASAFTAEFMDNTVKSETELRDCLPDVPLLGTTPGIATKPSPRRRVSPPTRMLLGGQQ